MNRLGVRAEEAAEFAARIAEAPGLGLEGVFTHFATADVPGDWDFDRQLERFLRLVDALPTHLDAHHNVHRSPELLPCFGEIAARHALPLREHCGVRYFSRFYGRWGGESHLEQVSVAKLLFMLEHELEEGITELRRQQRRRPCYKRSGKPPERKATIRSNRFLRGDETIPM